MVQELGGYIIIAFGVIALCVVFTILYRKMKWKCPDWLWQIGLVLLLLVIGVWIVHFIQVQAR